ncbi:heterokaryon incompatibility protein-domain-containing protein [Echria macrotheca]|uniref:Heterokaryon incompatibility protein-domain-containing protein n=1 Tax=Echria macrotheca TaxID=438768 RepID=A0AAJ0BGI6_9PEZI|nr:heterokaryon incompatibility protein-domain-containing protein [Echria macrotheca]
MPLASPIMPNSRYNRPQRHSMLPNLQHRPDLEQLISSQPSLAVSLDIPPDKPPHQLDLWWPPSVPYYGNDGRPIDLVSQRWDPGLPSSARNAADGVGSEDSIYPRELDAHEFRLICLEPLPAAHAAEDSRLIHITLETHAFDNHPEYEATSYTWAGEKGDSRRNHPVYIGPYWDVQLQTENCWDMLHFLVPPRGIRLVWVDAICINQRNIRERDMQVTKMGRIYSTCQQVVVYLGSDIVLDLPQGRYPRRHALQKFDDDIARPQLPEDFVSPRAGLQFHGVLSRRYFSRIWIIQELMLPKRVVMRIGDVEFTIDHTTVGYVNARAAETVVSWIKLLGSNRVSQNKLPEILSCSRRSGSSDPRDHLFGVLGVLEECQGHSAVHADYSLSIQEVSRDTPKRTE